LILSDLTIERLGAVVPQIPFVTEKHIWPIGFRSSRYFQSMLSNKKTQYTCEIIDVDGKPQFKVTAEDDPSNPITAHSPSAAWKVVLQRTNVSEKPFGCLRFGLTHPVVSQAIRELPKAEEAQNVVDSLSNNRKRKYSDSEASEDAWDSPMDDAEESIVEDSLNLLNRTKAPRVDDSQDRFSARQALFDSREEMDDLESAVATLEALKYCVVY